MGIAYCVYNGYKIQTNATKNLHTIYCSREFMCIMWMRAHLVRVCVTLPLPQEVIDSDPSPLHQVCRPVQVTSVTPPPTWAR